MPITPADIVALQQQISIERQKLDDREKALAVVAEMLREQTDAQTGKQPQLDLPPTLAPAQGGPTFTSRIRDAVGHFVAQEFTVVHIEDLLKAHGGIPSMNDPRSRISMVLGDMTKKGLLAVTHKGNGNQPYRYRLMVKPNGGHTHQ